VDFVQFQHGRTFYLSWGGLSILGRGYNQAIVAKSLDRAVLRVLDANANRAREALRVLEDSARFVLNRADLCGELKALRHGVTESLLPYLSEAIVQRDTPGDVGTDIKTEAEQTRLGSAAVAIAAGKRLGEALRAIEEFLKTGDAKAAGKIEGLRYRFYEIERRLVIALRPGDRFGGVRLYVLITESCCFGPWLQTAELAIEGGADCIQLREKNLSGAEFLARARRLAGVCRERGVLFIVNDRPDIAALAGADGVHVGQEDLPAEEARRILGDGKIVGVSTHNIDQARRAVADGADYIGVGPIFKSATKPRDFVAGLEYAAAVAADPEIAIPKVAIAGIGPENIREVLATGIGAVAVASAVTQAEDVRTAAGRLKDLLSKDVMTNGTSE
jgi:thiamine-phosphate pyrophosphorylase